MSEINADISEVKKNVKDSVYYQQLQKDLVAKKQQQVQTKQQRQHQIQQDRQQAKITTQDQVSLSSDRKSLFNWKTVSDKGDVSYELDVAKSDTFSTSILTNERSLGIVKMLGLRIDLQEKLQGFINKYIKNYVQTKSHNLMISKFAEFNVAILGQLLSVLGMTSEDIKKLQKEALESAYEENISLFTENEYNSEMLEIVGAGSKKELKAQKKLMGEMRIQFQTQMQRLGYPNYYSELRIKEIQIEQNRKIIQQFHEEKHNLEYQLQMVS